jgi:hypothetical protein
MIVVPLYDFVFSFYQEKMVEEHIDRSTKLPVIHPSSLSVVQNASAPIEKRQFIVSLNIGELAELQKLLYPNPEEAVKHHPLKREHDVVELYDCNTVGEQIDKIKRMKQAPAQAKETRNEHQESDDDDEGDAKVSQRSKARKRKH